MAESIRVVAWVVSAISATPINICTIPQQYGGINLLYEEGYTTEVLLVKYGKIC